ncbi:MAG TPA: V-type ATP synthase subunit I [Rhodospirillaceae bacterium]|nr:MAG: hypothetical protein A2018_06635 [Alphaproteobacteria bacterium GWF2_58_20]HAU29860.1 V-type ATP synthase subunit I [Rhodospirillaceae bacterium]
MTICPVQKVTLFGLSSEKRQVLENLQELGIVHVSDINNPNRVPERPGLGDLDSYKAFKYLMSAPSRRRQITSQAGFDAQGVVEDTLQVQDRIAELTQSRDHLIEKIRQLEPWGDFSFPTLEDMGGNHLWFYTVPRSRLQALSSLSSPWEIVRVEGDAHYVVVVAPEEPSGIPVPRTHTGAVPLSVLRQQLDHCEMEVDELEAQRIVLTHWCSLLARHLATAEDMANIGQAISCSFDDQVLMGVQGWVRKDHAEKVEAFARRHGLVCVLADPDLSDHPPTLLSNPDRFGGGEEVVKFYSMPGYRTVDPSLAIFFLFSLFFAIITSDAGYAVVLGFLLMGFWGKLSQSHSGRRLARLGLMIVGMCFMWGVLAGSYFGFKPPAGSFPARFAVIDVSDTGFMMKLSILIGVLHLLLANAMAAWSHRGSLAAVVPVSWMALIAGGAMAGFGTMGDIPSIVTPGYVLAGVGGLGVFLFSAPEMLPPRRPMDVLRIILAGLLGLTKITSAFGDALSYLRLFALGLAGSSLAMTFNQLAMNAADSLPGIGLIIAFVTLVAGHGLNIVLSIMGGVVHGLRLNVLEFFNWCITEEGYPFRAFAKKEIATWTP